MAIHKLFTYSVADENFQNTALYHIDRDVIPNSGILDGILPPEKICDLYPGPTTPVSQDAVVDSYIGIDGKAKVLRFLVGKISTLPDELGQPSQTCVYTELDANYAAKSKPDITLVEEKDGPPVATDPHGFTQVDETIYISDHDSTTIWLLGNEALPTASGDPPKLPIGTPIDIPVGTVLPSLSEGYNYHGNGIVALKNGRDWYLFALFINHNGDVVPEHDLSQLVRIKLPGTTPADMASIPLGPNTVDLDVVYDGVNPALLISAIGGGQHEDAINGTDSKISKVINLFDQSFTVANCVVDLLTGDDIGDFRCLAMYEESNGNKKICILTGYFGPNYTGFNWALYWINQSDLLSMQQGTPISKAIEDGFLHKIWGDTCDPGYYWSVMAGGGRLIFIKGSAMVIMDANSPDPMPNGNNVTFGRGAATGDIGNINANSIDFTEATEALIAQLLDRVGVHRHHHHRHNYLHHLAQAARQAAALAAQTDVEAKDA
jgi:hypothetical protein